MRLDFSAISDVGRVRKDNQDSGYVGPHVVAVCDGVGGAARGDIASSTAIAQLRKLEETPPGPDTSDSDLLGLVSNALHRAHDRIAELVDENPSLNGTSTTATVALFDGAAGRHGPRRRQPRLPLPRRRAQPAHQRPHLRPDPDRRGPDHRGGGAGPPAPNLILKAIDGIHDLEPDLFVLELKLGDRLLLCSDGASGVLDAGPAGRHPVQRHPRLRRRRAGPRQPRGRQLRQRHLPGRRRRRGQPRRPGPHSPLLVGAAADMRAAAYARRQGRAACSAATAPATPASSSRSARRSPTRSASRSAATRSPTPRRLRYAPHRPGPLHLAEPAARPRRGGRRALADRRAAPGRGARTSTTSASTTAPSSSTAASTPRCPASTCPTPTRAATSPSTGSATSTPARSATGIERHQPRRRPRHGRQPRRAR